MCRSFVNELALAVQSLKACQLCTCLRNMLGFGHAGASHGMPLNFAYYNYPEHFRGTHMKNADVRYFKGIKSRQLNRRRIHNKRYCELPANAGGESC